MAGRVPRGDSGGRYAAYDDHPAVPECGADGKYSGACGPAQCRGQRRDPPAPRTRRSSPMLRLDPCLRAAWASTGAEPLHHAALHIPTRRDGVVAIVRLRDIAGALHRLAAESAQALRTTRAAGVGKRHGGCRRSGRSPAPRGPRERRSFPASQQRGKRRACPGCFCVSWQRIADSPRFWHHTNKLRPCPARHPELHQRHSRPRAPANEPHAPPTTRDGRFVGQISRTDVLEALSAQWQ